MRTKPRDRLYGSSSREGADRGADARTQEIAFSKIKPAGLCGILLLTLSACSAVSVDPPHPTYIPSSTPAKPAILAGVKAAAAEAKLTAPLEFSAVRPTDVGPGHYFVCLGELRRARPTQASQPMTPAREPSDFDEPPRSPTSETRVVYFSVFFDNDSYKGARQSVIMEACEAQAFAPLDLAPPPAPKTGRSKQARPR
jgi:hypothetical protein